jgi:hypothetical protein
MSTRLSPQIKFDKKFFPSYLAQFFIRRKKGPEWLSIEIEEPFKRKMTVRRHNIDLPVTRIFQNIPREQSRANCERKGSDILPPDYPQRFPYTSPKHLQNPSKRTRTRHSQAHREKESVSNFHPLLDDLSFLLID